MTISKIFAVMISQAIKEECIICLDYSKLYGTNLEIPQFTIISHTHLSHVLKVSGFIVKPVYYSIIVRIFCTTSGHRKVKWRHSRINPYQWQNDISSGTLSIYVSRAVTTTSLAFTCELTCEKARLQLWRAKRALNKELARRLSTNLFYRQRRYQTYKGVLILRVSNFVYNLTFPSLPKDASNPLAKCQSTMDVKILVMVLSSNESIDMILRWRVNRPEISLRPPPGGPMAETNNWK